MQNTKQIRLVDCIAFVILGCYLLAGAAYSLFTAKWFPGFPAQLDISMFLGNVIGIYVESVIALTFGLILLSMGSLLWAMRKEA